MTVREPAKDVTKLPKWGQEYIQSLRNEIRSLNRSLDEATSKFPGSNVVMAGHLLGPDVTLPPNAQIQFYLGDKREALTNLIEVHHLVGDNKRLYVAGYGTGNVRILPRASNSFYVELEKL